MLRTLTAATLALTLSSLANDQVRFSNGDILSGSILNITDTGAVRFTYPEATEILEIEATGLDSLTFENQSSEARAHRERLFLTNGDELPCDILSMDNQSIKFETWYAGDFEIARDKVAKIRFDNKLESSIYSGPNNIGEWDKAENWNIEQGVLSVNGKGVLSKEFDLPNNFIIRFNLEWESTSPRFKLHLCGREATTVERIDRYYLDFNSRGFQYTRVTPRQFDKLGFINLRPRDFKTPQAQIELKVDRQNQQTILFVNGHKQGVFNDTSSSAPLGQHIILESAQRDGDILRIKDLHILEWGGNSLTQQKHEEVTNKKADTLFDSEGLRYSGHAGKIEKVEDRLTVFFDSKFSKTTLKVPSSRASMLYFKEQEPEESDKKTPYVATLSGGGSISLGPTTLNQDEAVTRHPILGECRIKRSAFSTLNSLASKSK